MSSPASLSDARGTFDHAAFNSLLRNHVRDARVDYAGWKASATDLTALDACLSSLSPAVLATLGAEERLAFFINAYNAITIRSILDAYPVASIRDIVGVWKVRARIINRVLWKGRTGERRSRN